LDTKAVLDALRRRWWVFLALAVLGTVVAALPSPKKSTDVTVTSWNAAHTLLLSSTSATETIYSDPVTFNQLQLFATTGEVPKRVADALGFDGVPAVLAGQVSVAVDQSTGAVRISTRQPTKERAVQVADEFADQLTSYLSERQDNLKRLRIAASLEQVDSLETEIKDLEGQLADNADDAVLSAQLDALSRQYSAAFEQYRLLQVDQGQLQLTTLERAQAVAVVSGGGGGLSAPQSRLSRGVLGGLVGGAAGLGVVLLLARTDRRIRSRVQAESIVGVRSQVVIPATVERQHGIVVVPERHEPLSDSYRTLRSVVGFVESGAAKAQGRVPVILVVSGASGDAKTSVVSNLAAAFVETGMPTVAVNTDFRRPALSLRMLGHKVAELGLDAHELATTPIRKLLTRSPIEGLVVFDLAGAKASPGELARVTAARIPELFQVGASAVVIDTSPVGVTAEVLELMPMADVIVLVVRIDHSSIDSVTRVSETVRALTKAPVLLVVVGEKVDRASYYEYTGDLDSAKQRPSKRKG
jgi:Mrp family chromosome partitioning ATPase